VSSDRDLNTLTKRVEKTCLHPYPDDLCLGILSSANAMTSASYVLKAARKELYKPRNQGVAWTSSKTHISACIYHIN